MTEIFISYSRRDKAFVERLLKALNENGYPPDQIWVDWQDIPASSKWEQEIRKGIEESNSVVFILSPAWAKSNECAKELKVAAEYNKRLFPIIREEVDTRTVPSELASLNWIFFRETDDFDEALQKLLAAVKTDLEWVAQHTSLLRRANRWETSGREDSYLLRGGELQAAEAWLSRAAEDKQPRPSPLQSEFVFASRQDEVRRQRRNLMMVSIAGAVSLILAIAAALLGFEAARQSQRALASELAAQANNLVHSQPDLALLLSLESNHIGDMLDETDAAWLGSLVTTLNSSPRLGTFLRAHTQDVRAVAFSRDGRWLATSGGHPSGNPGELLLWDMTATAQPLIPQELTGYTQRLLAVAFNADGTRLAAAGNDGRIFLWDPQNCCTALSAWEADGTVRALAFVMIKGREYVSAAIGRNVMFWELAAGKSRPDLALTIPTTDESVRILSLAASPKNDLLAAGGDDGTVTVWDLNTRELKFSQCGYDDPAWNDETVCAVSGEGATDIRGVAFNAEGTLLVSGSTDRRIWLWDAQTGVALARSPLGNAGGHINTVTAVAFNPQDDSQVASVSWDNTVRLWQLERGERWRFNPVETLAGHANSVWALAYAPDGTRLVSGSSDKTVILWKLDQLNQIGTPVTKMEKNVWALTASEDGKQLAAGDEAGTLQVWQFDGQALRDPVTVQHPGGILAVAYSHDNRWLASAGYDLTIRVWDTTTWDEVWTIENAHADQIWGLEFTRDDSRLASISLDQTAKLWDTSTHTLVGVPLEHEYQMYALTFIDAGTKLLTAGYADDIYLWDVSNPASPQRLGLLQGHSAFVNSLAFKPRYPSLLASTSDDKTLLIWNLDRKEHTPQVQGLSESMEAVTFSPNGEMLASATNNNTILLWQVDSEQCSKIWNKATCQPTQLGTPLTGHNAQVQNVVFLSDTKLVSSSADGQLILWDLEKRFWYDHACRVVGRGFTDSERLQYITEKLNPVLLNTVAWLSDPFDADPPEAPPSCILE